MKHKTTNILRLTNTVRKNIQREKLFHSWHDLLITLSGGQDSAFCLLVLYLLKNRTKKVFSYTWPASCSKTLSLKTKTKGDLLWLKKNQITNLHLTALFVTSYKLLWCNHFWQKDAFFTMEHVSKLAFSKNYTIHLYAPAPPGAPVQKVISEQTARNWRHKVMQRSSFFFCQPTGNKSEAFVLPGDNTSGACVRPGNKTGAEQKGKPKLGFGSSFCYGGASNKSEVEPKLGFGYVRPFVAGGAFCYELHPSNKKKRQAKQDYTTRLTQAKRTLTNKQVRFACKSKENQLCTNLACLECTSSSFRAQVLPKLKSGQFFDLFLHVILLTKPLLFTLADKKQSTGLVKHTEKSLITNNTLELSEFVCVQGHNKSDRAETILFNLIRGAGVSGISTLQWKQVFSSSKKTKSFCFNYMFYPIFSDFLKDISIIYLDTFVYHKKKIKIKKTENENFFSRLAILRKKNSQKRCFYNWTKNSGHNVQSEDITKERTKGLTKALALVSPFVCPFVNQNEVLVSPGFTFKKTKHEDKDFTLAVQQKQHLSRILGSKQKYHLWFCLSLKKAKLYYVSNKGSAMFGPAWKQTLFARWNYSNHGSAFYQSTALPKTTFWVMPCSGYQFATTLWDFKQPVRVDTNQAYFSKEAHFYCEQTNLHKTELIDFNHQNAIKIKMFYYQLKYKQNTFFYG